VSDARPAPGALVHGLRHTYATELATSNVSVYTLMKLLGHESMTTSQRYVTTAGIDPKCRSAESAVLANHRAQCRVPRRESTVATIVIVATTPEISGDDLDGGSGRPSDELLAEDRRD
jgi:integrase-like protein